MHEVSWHNSPDTPQRICPPDALGQTLCSVWQASSPTCTLIPLSLPITPRSASCNLPTSRAECVLSRGECRGLQNFGFHEVSGLSFSENMWVTRCHSTYGMHAEDSCFGAFMFEEKIFDTVAIQYLPQHKDGSQRVSCGG